MFGKPTAKSEGKTALDALDRALAAKPKADGHAFAEMTEHLCGMRDIMIADLRSERGAERDRLERLNAIISTALAGHFPLGNIPWQEVEHARGALKELIGEV